MAQDDPFRVESKGKLILVVDDETEVRITIASLLIQDGYSVMEAEDGRIALAMIEKRRPDAIISDIKMPEANGISLLEHVRAFSKMPFILMTGFSDILDTAEAQRIGATDFILKPFKQEELLASLDLAVNKESSPSSKSGAADEESENLDLNFCRLSIDEFVSGKVSLADIFVRISEKRYIKVARQNTDLSFDRIEAYKAKGLHFLYIRKEDFSRYIGLNLELTKIVCAKNSVPKAQRIKLMKHTSEIIVQDIFVNGVNKQKLESCSALVEAMVSALIEDRDLFDLLSLLQTHSDHLYAHSLGVALYSSMIAKEVGWTSTPTLFKIAMGGLLHDIGKKEIDRKILEKPRQALSLAERTTYESHSIRGKELLSLIKTVPEDVAQIAMHHHENGTGRAFPYRLAKSKIHPLAKLVAVANEFCDLVLKSPGVQDPFNAYDGIGRLYSLKGQELETGFLRALMTIFSYPIPSDMPKTLLPLLK